MSKKDDRSFIHIAVGLALGAGLFAAAVVSCMLLALHVHEWIRHESDALLMPEWVVQLAVVSILSFSGSVLTVWLALKSE